MLGLDVVQVFQHQPLGARRVPLGDGFDDARVLVGPAKPRAPVGLQLVGPEGSDNTLLALAREFEPAHRWRRWPGF